MIPFPADGPDTEEISIQPLTRLLVAAYLVEAGLVLVIVPWTVFWDRNYFGQVWPWLGAFMFNAYVRGAVTGVGLVTAVAGLRDFFSALSARSRDARVPTPPPGPRP